MTRRQERDTIRVSPTESAARTNSNRAESAPESPTSVETACDTRCPPATDLGHAEEPRLESEDGEMLLDSEGDTDY
jgi:hypothetical protein